MTVDEILTRIKSIKQEYEENKHYDDMYEHRVLNKFNDEKSALMTEVLQAIANGENDPIALAQVVLTIDTPTP